MNWLIRFVLFFGLAALVAWAGSTLFGADLGTTDYWQVHGVWLLAFLTFFPRLTLLFSSIPFGGFFWWLGWIFAPRLLVATLATLAYWQTNPFLVTISWLVAIGGESAEKYTVRQRVVRVIR
jgi:hypothetical protein